MEPETKYLKNVEGEHFDDGTHLVWFKTFDNGELGMAGKELFNEHRFYSDTHSK